MDIACTLFEKHFHLGLAILLNSLFHSGFKGKFIAGYRGNLPLWVKELENGPQGTWKIGEGFLLELWPIDTDSHFTHFKPSFFLEIFLRENPDNLFYFDPDIVLKAPWSFMREWVSYGISVCQDVNNCMPANHPVKLAWKKTAKDMGLAIFRESDFFYNGGYVALRGIQKDFFSLWEKIIKTVWTTEELKHFFAPGRESRLNPFCIADQDAFNLALMVTEHSISTVGPDGMDFIHGGSIMSHAIGPLKPWFKNFTLSALQGVPPSKTDKLFWRFAELGPIRPFSSGKLRSKKIDLTIGKIFGRFLRRT